METCNVHDRQTQPKWRTRETPIFEITFKTTLDKKYFLIVIGNWCRVVVVSKQDLGKEFSASGFSLCPCNV